MNMSLNEEKEEKGEGRVRREGRKNKFQFL